MAPALSTVWATTPTPKAMSTAVPRNSAAASRTMARDMARALWQRAAPAGSPRRRALYNARAAMLSDLVAALRTWADGAGAVGVLVISLVDSAGLPLPNATDALVLYLTVQHPARWWWYVAAAIAGAVLGSLPLYWIGRRGGAGAARAPIRRRAHWPRPCAWYAAQRVRRHPRAGVDAAAAALQDLRGAGRRHRVAGVAVRRWRSPWAAPSATASRRSWRRPTATRPSASSTSGRPSSRWRWPIVALAVAGTVAWRRGARRARR